MTRDEKLQKLATQYSQEFAGQNYPEEFKPHGSMTECNFGGKLIILSNDGESCIVWSDWADEAVSDKLEEFEIVYEQNPDNDQEMEIIPGFIMNLDTENETFYPLNDFMKI